MEFQNKEESWSIQEEFELIKNIKKILPKNSEKKSYITTLSNFDWNTISTQTKSPESCRKHFYKLKSMICAQKSLYQISNEIMLHLQDPKLRKAHIPVPYNRFLKDYSKENKNKLKDSKSYFKMLTSEGAKAWKDLPNDVRQLYKNQYKDELKLKDLNTDTGITKSKNSFSHFMQDVVDQFQMSKEGKRKAWESWCQLPFDEKLLYIKMSIEDEARCKDELAEYLFNNQNAKTFFVLGPTWEEKEKYLIYTGMPKAPPKKYALLFLETLNGFEEYKLGKEKLIVACQMFKDLPADLQERTKNDFHEAWDKYYFEFTEWKNQQTPVIQNLSELYVKWKKIKPYNTKRNCKDITSKVDLSSSDRASYSPHDIEQPHTSYKLQDNENFSKVFETANKSTVQRVKNTSTAAKKTTVKYNGSPSFGRKITLSFLSDITPTSSGNKKSNKEKSNVGIKRKNKANQSVPKKMKGESNKENKCPNNSKQIELQGQEEETAKFPGVIREPKPVAKTPWLYCLSEQRTILGSPGRARQRALKLYKENESAIKGMHQLKVKEYKESIQNFLDRLPSEYKKTYLESRSNQIDDTKYINSFQELLDSHPGTT